MRANSSADIYTFIELRLLISDVLVRVCVLIRKLGKLMMCGAETLHYGEFTRGGEIKR